jgi:hypothetical protein
MKDIIRVLTLLFSLAKLLSDEKPKTPAKKKNDKPPIFWSDNKNCSFEELHKLNPHWSADALKKEVLDFL